MKALSKLGLLFAIALLGVAATAVSAQAQVIHPNNSAFEGLSGDSTLSYGAAVVACDTATASGTSGNEQSFIDLELTFTDNCNISGLAATVACSTMDTNGDGGVELLALDATTDEGTVNLNPNFSCVVTVPGVCTVTVSGGANGIDLPDANSSADLDNVADTITADVDVPASRTGSTLCGPASGTGNFSGVYAVDPPADPEID